MSPPDAESEAEAAQGARRRGSSGASAAPPANPSEPGASIVHAGAVKERSPADSGARGRARARHMPAGVRLYLGIAVSEGEFTRTRRSTVSGLQSNNCIRRVMMMRRAHP
eukprot:SAG22_NODE_1390_length_4520_cov_1.529744_5_plen_110_part_00